MEPTKTADTLLWALFGLGQLEELTLKSKMLTKNNETSFRYQHSQNLEDSISIC